MNLIDCNYVLIGKNKKGKVVIISTERMSLGEAYRAATERTHVGYTNVTYINYMDMENVA